MKKSSLILAGIMIAGGTLFTNCTTPAEKTDAAREDVQEAKEDLKQAKEDFAEQFIKFKFDTEEKITANDKLIADLKSYSKDKKKEVKADYDKAVSDLEAKNQEMKRKIEDYKAEGNEKWDAFKDEFNHDMDQLGEAIKDIGKKNVK